MTVKKLTKVEVDVKQSGDNFPGFKNVSCRTAENFTGENFCPTLHYRTIINFTHVAMVTIGSV